MSVKFTMGENIALATRRMRQSFTNASLGIGYPIISLLTCSIFLSHNVHLFSHQEVRAEKWRIYKNTASEKGHGLHRRWCGERKLPLDKVLEICCRRLVYTRSKHDCCTNLRAI